MNKILETERLVLREFTTTDSNFILDLVNSPGWIEYIGDRNIRTTEQAVAYLLNGPMKSYRDNGFGLCMVQLKNEGTPIGMCGIIKRDTLEKPDIGFAFLPEFMGKGYAFEMADATLNYAITELKLPIIYAITIPKNSSSRKLLEKIGLKFVKTISSPENEELLLYSN
jgi:RimJ/RimL family protein N-acetyltransferase